VRQAIFQLWARDGRAARGYGHTGGPALPVVRNLSFEWAS